MSALLYAWEFGAGMGHVGPFLPLGRALRERGYAVHWAVCQPAEVGAALLADRFAPLPAPTCAERPAEGPPLNYADILLRFGWRTADELLGLVQAWRELITLTGSRLILADHAPTALLAARTLGLPAMLFANGFTAPPALHPTPNLRPWLEIPNERLMALEDAALTSANRVLARFGQAPLSALHQLFVVREQALLTFPELDHYENRGDARYWGSLPLAGGGQAIDWPPLPGPRLFVYLRAECPHWRAVLDALQRLGLPTALWFPGLSAAVRAQLSAPHWRVLDRPADLAQARQEADAAILYASLATTTAFLLAGKPMLLLPWHLEQFLLARRVAQLGAALITHPEKPPGDLARTMAELLQQPRYRSAAQGFAEKYAAFSPQKVEENLLRRVSELLAPDPLAMRGAEK